MVKWEWGIARFLAGPRNDRGSVGLSWTGVMKERGVGRPPLDPSTPLRVSGLTRGAIHESPLQGMKVQLWLYDPDRGRR